jgi:hypothetical protein
MVKDFRFVVTLHNVHDDVKRGDVKAKMEQMLNHFTRNKYCSSVQVSRFSPSSEVRKGKVMQKMANDVLTDAVKRNDKKGGGTKNGN